MLCVRTPTHVNYPKFIKFVPLEIPYDRRSSSTHVTNNHKVCFLLVMVSFRIYMYYERLDVARAIAAWSLKPAARTIRITAGTPLCPRCVSSIFTLFSDIILANSNNSKLCARAVERGRSRPLLITNRK